MVRKVSPKILSSSNCRHIRCPSYRSAVWISPPERIRRHTIAAHNLVPGVRTGVDSHGDSIDPPVHESVNDLREVSDVVSGVLRPVLGYLDVDPPKGRIVERREKALHVVNDQIDLCRNIWASVFRIFRARIVVRVNFFESG